MTLAQAIRNAIEAERAAEAFYRTLAEGTDDPEARRFLQQMTTLDDEHAKALEETARKLVDGELPERADAPVKGIESAIGWADARGLTLDQALEVALESELNAALHYDALADTCTGELSAFFARLARTEEQHAERLRGLVERRAGEAD